MPLLSLVFVLSAALASAADPGRMAAALAAARDSKSPDLAAFASPALSRALKDPGSLWDFLTEPGTPYTDRRAAAIQGGRLFRAEDLPRLLDALQKLREEENDHRWGLKPHPLSAMMFLPRARKKSETRVILGRNWVLPAEDREYPLTWIEEEKAPWPWAVRRSLEDLFTSAKKAADDTERAAGWMRASLSWLEDSVKRDAAPASADKAAQLWVEAAGIRRQTFQALACRRAIALDGRFPFAAEMLARDLMRGYQVVDEARSQALSQTVLIDIFKSSPHPGAQRGAAWALRGFSRYRLDSGEELRLATPAAAVLAASEAALDPAYGDAWTRLFNYAFGVCALLEDDAPFQPPQDNSLAPTSPKVAEYLAKFEEWFRAQRPRLSRLAAKEAPEIEKARADLASAWSW